MNANVMSTEAYEQNLTWQLMDVDEITTANGIVWRVMNRDPENIRLRAIVPMPLFDQRDTAACMYSLLNGILQTILSETTNNDACRITIIETSAHFDVHYPNDPILSNVPFGAVVVYDAVIDDYLT